MSALSENVGKIERRNHHENFRANQSRKNNL